MNSQVEEIHDRFEAYRKRCHTMVELMVSRLSNMEGDDRVSEEEVETVRALTEYWKKSLDDIKPIKENGQHKVKPFERQPDIDSAVGSISGGD